MSKVIILTIFIFLFILGINSYGTSDVQFWCSWAIAFTTSGFWTNYSYYVDYPLYAALFVNLAGWVTKLFFGTVSESNFPAVFKTLLLPFMYLCYRFLSILTAKPKLVMLLLILNPAIFLNTSILGYIDILLMTNYFACLLLLHKTNKNPRYQFFTPFIFSLLFFSGFHIKPQWSMFALILGFTAGYLFLKRKLILPAVLGIFVGLILPIVIISFGTENLTEVVQRIIWVKISTIDKVANQKFVVANFPNLWQILNYFVHQNPVSGLFQDLSPWKDRPLAQTGKLLFLIAGGLYSIILIPKVIKDKADLIKKVIILTLWLNLIYAFFNTSVHENHLIPTVYFAVYLLIVAPTKSNLILYIFLTFINFFNLFYFYACGMTGLFGRCHKFKPLNFNFSLPLSYFYLVFLIRSTIRALRNKGDNFGLTD